MGKPVKGIGIIGYGGFGEFIRQAWNRMDSVQVVAVCDADAGRAPKDTKFYTQVNALLADPEVEIVSIATPPNSHAELSLVALEAGKHLLVEKPPALSAADALHIKETAERSNLVASVDFMLRYNAIVEALALITQNEVLGKLRRVDLRNYAMLDQTPDGHWFWNPDISGRILLEHGVHFFNLANSVIGAPASEVIGLSVERKPGIEDRMFAAVKYENNVIGTYWHSFSRPRVLETTTFHFAFDLGEIDIYGWIPLELKLWGWTSKAGRDVLAGINRINLRDVRMEPFKAQSSEFFYDVSYDVHASLVLDRPKMDVYAENLRSIMSDLVAAIDDPSHQMRVTLDDGVEAVRIAELATKYIHP